LISLFKLIFADKEDEQLTENWKKHSKF
jgi:hypothetical protein